MRDLVSIIMPAYNAGLYIAEAIDSVVNQTWNNWELIIINDGSTDDTGNIIKKFNDERIWFFKQSNKGVSAARNVGLNRMKGEYFCFLDADDKLPPGSLQSRINVFENNSEITFVDGMVEKRGTDLSQNIGWFKPKLSGKNPLRDLVSLNGNCFFGLSWMIKREFSRNYSFMNNLSHAEDLLFYMEESRKGGIYAFAPEVIYIYRDNADSAMKDLKGLELGYRKVFDVIRGWSELNYTTLMRYKFKSKRIIFLSYLKVGKLFNAVKSLL